MSRKARGRRVQPRAVWGLVKQGPEAPPVMTGNIQALAKAPRRWRVDYEVEHFEVDEAGQQAVAVDHDRFTTYSRVLLHQFLVDVIEPYIDGVLAQYQGRLIDVRFKLEPIL
ncbi:hypothetical protein [Pseudomonas sp. KCJK9000]|uniref:hypothetical protein n=1 Tax=Pseudomonas sp. KCJK9000 TaxID=3344566 RepID=UPI003905E096